MATSSAPGAANAPASFEPHDHSHCAAEARAEVDAACAARGLRLTPARAFVLDTLLASHRAMTAYELLESLAAAGMPSQPPVVYRALDFLVSNGFAHRIERLGAFAACTCGPHAAGATHRAAFLICRNCRRVAETAMARPPRSLAEMAGAAGFAIERVVIEAEGLCAHCREDAA
ncbi:MAG: Fur family transcriptional regulator [Amaricoccus sp.]|uniref:Fur family transcriptional regulator n=1 Tax=Amaricoccus sp. TaxID=1872485 RepID=UPI0039E5BD83